LNVQWAGNVQLGYGRHLERLKQDGDDDDEEEEEEEEELDKYTARVVGGSYWLWIVCSGGTW
jgi:hypothetical protein